MSTHAAATSKTAAAVACLVIRSPFVTSFLRVSCAMDLPVVERILFIMMLSMR
jgi:hypothetical protein